MEWIIYKICLAQSLPINQWMFTIFSVVKSETKNCRKFPSWRQHYIGYYHFSIFDRYFYKCDHFGTYISLKAKQLFLKYNFQVYWGRIDNEKLNLPLINDISDLPKHSFSLVYSFFHNNKSPKHWASGLLIPCNYHIT